VPVHNRTGLFLPFFLEISIMLFKVRPPFAIHHEKVVTTQQGGQTVKQPVVESHFAGDTIDFDAASAKKHLHKLEPADSEATKLFDTQYADNAIVASARGGGQPSPTAAEIQAMIDAAVAKSAAAQPVAKK
jgi:hypothetical protein